MVVITKADWAGAQRIVYEIVKYVIDNSINLQIDVAVGSNGLLCDKLKELGVNIILLKELKHPINLKNDIKGYKELVKLIKDNKYNVVHAHSTKAGILARLAATKCGVKNIIYTVHGWWPILQYSGLKRRLAALVEAYMATKCSALVFICEKDIEIANKYHIGKAEQYVTIYNSITVPTSLKHELKKEFNLPKDCRIVGNVARVDKQKNPMLFLDIAEENIKNNNNVYYIWVGDGELQEQVNEAIVKRNLQEKVRFIGFRENGIDYINDFDVLLMTSEAEGMPITVLEALALNKPIISTDVGGIKEMVSETNVYNINDKLSDIVKLIDKAEYKCCKEMGLMQKAYIDLYFK